MAVGISSKGGAVLAGLLHTQASASCSLAVLCREKQMELVLDQNTMVVDPH